MLKGRHSLGAVHRFYQENGGPLDRDAFDEVCAAFNKEVMRQLIEEGRVFDMGCNLSTLQIVRMVRKGGKPMIDWGKSTLRKQEIIEAGGTPYHKDTAPDGEKWFVYYDDDWVLKFHWHKYHVDIVNQRVYKFEASRSEGVGMRKILAQKMRSNPLAYLTYDLGKSKRERFKEWSTARLQVGESSPKSTET